MKKALIVLLCMSAMGFGGLFLIFQNNSAPPPDMVAINDTVMTATRSIDQSETVKILTDELIREYNDMDAERRKDDRNAAIYLCAFLGVLTASGISLILYCERGILSPFRKLQNFARNVASGNLDIPLEMDRHGVFGAFTESFDLMRENLKIARENERKANQSKKELVASLSHDIMTPLASIKAVTELMMVKTRDADIKGQLEITLSKADQISLLVTNMFQATLEELEQLKVQPEDMLSSDLHEMIRIADYEHRVTVINIPECAIVADKTRLQQVFDNIISNSYKYAGTEITITSCFDGPFLTVEVRDSGPGVARDDLPLVLEKFYRGGNATGKSGSGLGLYISKHLMNKMGGDIKCEQNEKGFAVIVSIAM